MGLFRLLFSIAVVAAHSSAIHGVSLVGGLIAVQGFFMLSGFFMSLILNEKYVGKNRSYWLYLSNRLLRIYPAYWLVLILIVLFSFFQFYVTRTVGAMGDNYGAFSIYDLFKDQMNFWTGLVFAFTNLFVVGQDLLYFMGLDIKSGSLFFTTDITNIYPALYSFMFIPQSWAIALDMAFYALAPFIVRRASSTIIFLLVTSLLVRLIVKSLGLPFDPWLYRFFPSMLVYFLMGVVSFRIYQRIRMIKINRLILQIIFAFFLLITIFYRTVYFSGNEAVYLILFLLGMPFIFLFTREWRFDRYLGELSYIIYIGHIFMLSIINYFHIPIVDSLGFTLTLWTLGFSVFINELTMKRVEAFRQRRLAT